MNQQPLDLRHSGTPLKTIPLAPLRRGLAGRVAGWFTVSHAPQFYLSNWSGFIHRVKHAETVVDIHTGKPQSVAVHHWCGGMGSVGPIWDSKGEWRENNNLTNINREFVCEVCERKFRNYETKEIKKQRKA